jgi:hypothetical protein
MELRCSWLDCVKVIMGSGVWELNDIKDDLKLLFLKKNSYGVAYTLHIFATK